jgi:hypothetical protein
VTIPYETKEGSANSAVDFVAASGDLVFEHGELEKAIRIEILSGARFEENLTFSVELKQPTSFGAKLGMIPVSTVTLTNDEQFKKMIEKFANMMAQNQ